MPILSIVIPVRDEAENVAPLFEALAASVHVPSEVLLVFDSDDDPTIPVARELANSLPFPLRFVRNSLGKGPASALKAGFAAAQGEAVLVVMADLSDDLARIDEMVAMFLRGYDVVCASRYMPGGQHRGGPWLKRSLSRLAGLSLNYLAGLPTRDATNSFRLYRTQLLRSIPLESDSGFEVTLELTVKAWIAGHKIAEVPARWVDRTAGRSKFKFLHWLPGYTRWYLLALRTGLQAKAKLARADVGLSKTTGVSTEEAYRERP